ncbi:CRISPR-associated helicase Cas3, subtype I-F/YPEST [Leclercia adecarboxylata]|uniref:CRISPR-associated helicase Cas3, subtype I-F/YPEST n=1 Tax=Leclercia adecarboxylata TaxID=83655 RepID=A0A4U9HM93_9ENTR|nr:CRISPR-associated helicase Cas3, subtype I-F/YPEST [Leclercia adecarboxylata]
MRANKAARSSISFAERKGNSAWQTSITLEGLNTLRRLLRKTARRNTAVACHWIKKSGQTELVWIVGNLKRFNAQGQFPLIAHHAIFCVTTMKRVGLPPKRLLCWRLSQACFMILVKQVRFFRMG